MRTMAVIPTPRVHPASNKWVVAVSVTVGALMGAVDASVVNVALPSIQATFGASITEVTWIATAYLIAVVLLMPFTGWLTSILGRKVIYQTSLLVFVGASVIAAMASSLPALIVARTLQGLGASLLFPIGQAILLDTFPQEERGLATAIYGVVTILGPTIGPLIGGWITDNYTWPWIFLINVPIGCIGFLMTTAFVPEAGDIKTARGGVDAIGIALLAVGLSSLLIVLEQGDTWDWFSSPLVWGFGIVALSCLMLFVLWEFFGTDAPVVDLTLYADRTFAAASLCVLLLGTILFGVFLLQSLFLQNLLGYTATQTGVAFLPRGLVIMGTLMAAGMLFNVLGPRVMTGVGVGFLVLGQFLMAPWTLDAGFAQIQIPLVIGGVGLAVQMVSLLNAGVAGIDRRRLASATGLLNLQVQLGGALGTAILATMIERGTTQYHAMLVGHVTATSTATSQWTQLLTSLMVGRGGSDAVTAQHQAFAVIDELVTQQASVLSFEHVFEVVAFLGLLLFVCVPFFPKRGGAVSTHGGVI